MQAFAIRVKILNSLEDQPSCISASKLEERIKKLFTEAVAHSRTFDTEFWWDGGNYRMNPFRPKEDLLDK